MVVYKHHREVALTYNLANLIYPCKGVEIHTYNNLRGLRSSMNLFHLLLCHYNLSLTVQKTKIFRIFGRDHHCYLFAHSLKECRHSGKGADAISIGIYMPHKHNSGEFPEHILKNQNSISQIHCCYSLKAYAKLKIYCVGKIFFLLLPSKL